MLLAYLVLGGDFHDMRDLYNESPHRDTPPRKLAGAPKASGDGIKKGSGERTLSLTILWIRNAVLISSLPQYCGGCVLPVFSVRW